jgi:uroporphyrinogen-III synthase
MADEPLTGRVIALPEARELAVFAGLLERRGAKVLRCPLVGILDAPDPGPVLTWLRTFVGGGCDDLILLTGEGLRRLISCLERHEPALREPFLQALQQVRRITRGPKPARALRELGLVPDIAAEVPTTAGIMESLLPQALTGRRVGVQLYGTEPNLPLQQFLAAAGAQVLPVAPYVYADATDDTAVHALLERMAAGTVDAIAFTSASQVTRLFKVGGETLVRRALQRTAVAAVGPVVAATLSARGIATQIMPHQSWFMKPLTAALAQALKPGAVK